MKKVLSLQIEYPNIAKEWHPTKNGDLKPTDVTSGSSRYVWWICNKGHEWEASITNRKKAGCPVCSGRKVLAGFNDLATTNPELAEEWHPTKNGDLKPTGVTAGSGKIVWWKCEKGHEWEAKIANRKTGRGCPYCSNKRTLQGYNDLMTTNPELAEEWHPTKNGNLKPTDVTLGSGIKVWWKCEKGHEWETPIYSRKKFGCPYCSNYLVWKGYNDLTTTNPELAAEWHPTKNGDIKPSGFTSGSSEQIWWKCEKGHEWQATISSRKKSDCPFCSGRKVLQGYNDLTTTNPELAAEWHPTKNGDLKPTDVTAGSSKTIWWKCEKGHEWQASLYNRKRSGCPYCSNKAVLTGYNDLATTNPDLAKEWHPIKNGDLKPTDVTTGSNIQAWWKCKNGHEWQALLSNRTKEGCPYCAGRKVLQGYNDLTTTNPELAVEWHPAKNGDLKPTDVTAGSSKTIWWKCEKGHEWQASLYSRKRSGCPYCSNKAVLTGYNDLATTNPGLAEEWHPIKNGDLKPTDVTVGSSRYVWWICNKGHEWEASIANRKKAGCPICSGKKVLAGSNDLATTNPDLAEEWHPTKNRDLKPCNVNSGSDKKVWWLCSKGHEWRTAIKTRAKQGTGCPYCSGRKAITGENDLMTISPFLASEWDEEKNGIPASEVSFRSGRKYWWKCSACGFKWEATPHNRTNGAIATGCPKCALEKQTSYPEQVLYFYIKKHYPDAINKYRDIFTRTMELDVFIPSLNTGIEYDGEAWHKGEHSEKTERRKYRICHDNGIKLIRIKEGSNNNYQNSSDIQLNLNRHPSNSDLRETLILLSQYVPMEDDFNITFDECQIRKQFVSEQNEASLEKQRPDIANQWNYNKNHGLLPSMFSAGSNRKVWWKCEKGHEWQAVISSRKHNGCPYCSGKKTLEGFNDLGTKRPDLARQWNAEKNGILTPGQFAPQSNKKVWWKCDNGHEWEATINSRYRGNGCPYCRKNN